MNNDPERLPQAGALSRGAGHSCRLVEPVNAYLSSADLTEGLMPGLTWFADANGGPSWPPDGLPPICLTSMAAPRL